MKDVGIKYINHMAHDICIAHKQNHFQPLAIQLFSFQWQSNYLEMREKKRDDLRLQVERTVSVAAHTQFSFIKRNPFLFINVFVLISLQRGT